MEEAPNSQLWVAIRVPRGWEEGLIHALAEEGWGAALSEQVFPGGLLDGEGLPTAECAEVVLLLDPQRWPGFCCWLREQAQACGWSADQWTVRSETRQETDWEDYWRHRWRPFRCGRLVIHAEFHDPARLRLREGDRLLGLRTGSAFGTGRHASTRLALRVIQRWCAVAAPRNLLDVGTGSGILAVAAACCGVPWVAGMDPDPNSATEARGNARRNGVADRARFWRGTLESAGGTWEAVVANLQAELIAQYAPLLARRLRRGGRLLAGGILAPKMAAAQDRLRQAGLRPLDVVVAGRWVGLELDRP